MPYVLGVDVGSSRTAAATCRLDASPRGDVDLVVLGLRSNTMASTVYLAPDGSVVVGDAAERQALAEPGNVARGFLGRLGDETPLMVGGEPCLPEDLAAALIMWVVERASATRSGPPDHIMITHPPAWGGFRRMLLHRALQQAGLSGITLLPTPIAAGEGHAARHQVDADDALAIYSLGADSFTASVIRRTPISTFELLGHGDAAEHVGGSHFDDALVAHVRGGLDGALDGLDPADPQDRIAMLRLRDECMEAKHRLSFGTETAVEVRLPGVRTQIKITRVEFEKLARPTLESTVDILRRTVDRVAGDGLGGTLLIGGCSRIPLITELVSARLPGDVLTDADPELTAARGAALAARRLVTGGLAGAAAPRSANQGSGTVLDGEAAPSAAERTAIVVAVPPEQADEESPARPPVDIAPPELPQNRSIMNRFSGAKPGLIGAITVVVLAAGIWLTFALRGNSSPPTGPGIAPPGQAPATVTAVRAPAPPAVPGPPGSDERDEDGR